MDFTIAVCSDELVVFLGDEGSSSSSSLCTTETACEERKKKDEDVIIYLVNGYILRTWKWERSEL